ncbi:MAG: phosphatidate cytidylyltransferase [Deinococcota bacterium]|jgi:phosphatidate cytidylyltransferase|nr:phosphatidate cytidylyltransferase [Deinococcota bacterium]
MAFPYARIISSLVAFISLLLVLWVGLPLLAPAYLLFALVAVQEYSVMMNLRGIPIRKRSLWVATVLTLPASLPVTYPGMEPLFAGVSWREALLGMVALYLIALEVARPNEQSMNAVIYSLFGYFYIPWLFAYVITLRYTPDGVLGLWYLALPALGIISSDVGAYVVGKLFGKHKLAPLISPKKTLEGALGGLGLAVIMVSSASYALDVWLGIHVDLYHSIFFAILVASAAQLGDLFESLIKRWAGVKDAGFFMPGHGGALDRIDSALFAVPVTYYFVTLVILR